MERKKKQAYFSYACEEVRAQPRPRFRRNGSPYTPKKDKEYREAIQQAYKDGGGVWFGEAPLRVVINIYRALPNSYKRKTREVVQPDTFKPDIDNLAKAILDALNGIAWVDDAQIVGLEVHKWARREREGDLDRLAVGIYEVEG